jgi:hypothetical protein
VNIAQFFTVSVPGFHTALTLCPRFAAWVFRSYTASLSKQRSRRPKTKMHCYLG